MMNKLYDNCFLTDLTTEVKEIKEENGFYWHTFKETIFYKEGGGMSSDIGVVDNHEVLDMKEENGNFWHLLDTKLDGNVFMSVNLHERFRKCQIHTAQHLISAMLSNIYKVKTLSHHVNDDENDIEFDFENFTDKMAFELQVLINGLIRDDLEVTIKYPSRQEALQFVSADVLKHEQLRVVRIGNLDYNLCGCMHVPSLRYIQMIKILGYEKTTKGYKVKYICGDQLLDCITRRYHVLDEAAQTLAVSHLYINTGIHNVLNEKRALDRDLLLWKQKYLQIKRDELIAEPEFYVFAFFDDMDVKSLAMLASMMKQSGKLVILMAKIFDNCHVIVADGTDDKMNCADIFKQIADQFNLRGGGNKEIAQGGGIYQEGIKEYIKRLKF